MSDNKITVDEIKAAFKSLRKGRSGKPPKLTTQQVEEARRELVRRANAGDPREIIFEGLCKKLDVSVATLRNALLGKGAYASATETVDS